MGRIRRTTISRTMRRTKRMRKGQINRMHDTTGRTRMTDKEQQQAQAQPHKQGQR